MSKHIDYVAPPYRLVNQITLIMGMAVLLFIAAQGLIMSSLMRRTLDEQTQQEQVTHTRGAAYMVEQYLVHQREHLASFYVEDSSTSADALKQLLEDSPTLMEVTLIGEADEIIAIEKRGIRSWFDTSVMRQDWFQTRKPHLEWRASRGDTAILMSQPIDAIYTLIAYFDAQPIQDLLAQFRGTEGEVLTLRDTNGQALIAAGDLPSDTTTFHTAHPLDKPNSEILTGWQVRSDIPDDIAHAAIGQIRTVLVALFALWLILAIIIGRLLTRRISIPLNNLIYMVRRLEAGVYVLPVKVQMNSEIGILAAAFNRLREVITERENALENANVMLQLRSDELENLSRQTIAVEEEERRRVSRELHDSLGQTLAALKMNLDVAQRLDDPERVGELLKEAGKITVGAMDEVHRISQNLRPTILDDLGLRAALEWHIDQYRQHFDLDVDPDFSAIDGVELAVEARITAYRFLQEALNNIQKHAQASQVVIKTLRKGDALIIGIRDNGRGFNPLTQKYMSHHLPLGLTGLEERLLLVGGRLEVRSAVGQGATLVATLPILK
jgi:signal transduction histidine kinase